MLIFQIPLFSSSKKLLFSFPTQKMLIDEIICRRPHRVEVKKGQTIRLSCKATGFPKPNYAWYKDGGRLSSFHDRFRVILFHNYT